MNLGLGVKTPIGWTSGKPKLYFPLDSDIAGTRLGVNYNNIAFVNDSVIGNALYNPSNDVSVSYYNLGTYPEADFCFIEPENCPRGISIALWLKIVGSVPQWQGILTTTNRYPMFDLQKKKNNYTTNPSEHIGKQSSQSTHQAMKF